MTQDDRFDANQGTVRIALLSCLMQWECIATAPFDRKLEVAVFDKDGPHALAFACRRTASGWINAETRQQVDVRPTHWREWDSKA